MERAIHLTRAGPYVPHGLLSGPAIVWLLALAKLLFHLFTAGSYGIFRDELYYLACAEHLDFGYVDQPPLIALIAWIARHLFGESLLGLRLLPALAGASRSEEHTSELQSQSNLVCRLLLEKKKKNTNHKQVDRDG